jgi:periplasmic copper chaperone A
VAADLLSTVPPHLGVPVRPTVRRSVTTLLLGGLLTALVAAPAAAHVTVDPSSTAAGAYALLDVRVPHGCDGEATAKVEVRIPDGVVSVKPEQVPGWAVSTEIGEYDEPIELHGSPVTEGVRVVAWTAEAGQELPDDLYRDFGLSVRLPDAEGETLVFPAVQTCVDGNEAAWIETSDDPDAELDHPAPTVTLTAGGGGHGGDASDDTDEVVAEGEETAELTASPAAAETGSGTGVLTYIALAVGLLGLIAGLAGYRAARAARG